MPRRNRQRGGRPGNGRWGSPRKRLPERDETPERPPRLIRPASPGPLTFLPFDGGRDESDRPAAIRTCGGCLEWYPHEEGGRGDCHHPGSGFVSPWSDTAACPFYSSRR